MTQVVEYNIDRKGASRLLKVSVRTVDRYLKSKKLSSRIVDGRVWLSKGEIEGFMGRKHRGLKVGGVSLSTGGLSSDKVVDNLTSSVDSVDLIHTQATKTQTKKRSGNTYKKLYEDLQDEIKEKQERLEIANYRVGQLENQLRNSIPLLQYHRENSEKQLQEKKFKEEIKVKNTNIKTLAKKLRNEQIIKKIFAFLCFLIMALQPLWLLLLPVG